MTLKQYIALMALGTTIALTALVLVMMSVSPSEAGVPIFVVFYIALFCSTLGVSTLIGLIVRLTAFAERHSIPQKVELSFRQGTLFGMLTTAALILQSNHLLNSWNALLLIGAVSSIEMAFMGLASRR